MIGRLQMTIHSALRQYDVVGNRVFGRPRRLNVHGVARAKFGSKTMIKAIQEVLQENARSELDRRGRHAGDHTRMRMENEKANACHT
jgi:hypothetical protein